MSKEREEAAAMGLSISEYKLMQALKETEDIFTTASRLEVKEGTVYAVLARIRRKADRGWNLVNYIQLVKRKHPRLRKLLTSTGRLGQERF